MSLAFDPQARLIVVPTRLRGLEGSWVAKLALDTGATYTIVSVHVLATIGHDPALSEERVEITMGSGVELVARVSVQSIGALGHQRGPFPILCHTLPPGAGIDGVLGLDFFRGMRLVVDFREGVVSLD